LTKKYYCVNILCQPKIKEDSMSHTRRAGLPQVDRDTFIELLETMKASALSVINRVRSLFHIKESSSRDFSTPFVASSRIDASVLLALEAVFTSGSIENVMLHAYDQVIAFESTVGHVPKQDIRVDFEEIIYTDIYLQMCFASGVGRPYPYYGDVYSLFEALLYVVDVFKLDALLDEHEPVKKKGLQENAWHQLKKKIDQNTEYLASLLGNCLIDDAA